MPPKKINSLEDLNEIKRLMAEGEGRETDALHSRIEEDAYEMRERNFGRGKRMGFEKKEKRRVCSD
jgi:hypothetical protein